MNTIVEMLVPDAYVFAGSWGYTRQWLILHKTAGFHTAQEVAAYFQRGSDGLEVSSHYVIGLDGTIVQCVSESDGAGANGVLEPGHDAWWSGNPNLVTFSIEHVDPATDNSTAMPEAQKQASFQLIREICQRHNIPMRTADATGGITGHFSIDPGSRARCPGNYPWNELWAFLNNESENSPVFSDSLCVAIWESQAAYFAALKQPLPPRDTGIFDSMRDEWRNHGRFRGVVLSAEYPVILPNDHKGVAQNYAGGTCTWDDVDKVPVWF